MHKKRFLVWTMIAALLLSLIPATFTTNVQAAATFFIPDNGALASTSSSGVDLSTLGGITRSKVLVTTSKQLDINGTFQFVAKDTMSVKVEQLTFSQELGYWTTDSSRTTT